VVRTEPADQRREELLDAAPLDEGRLQAAARAIHRRTVGLADA
jgi:hypothetical protein